MYVFHRENNVRTFSFHFDVYEEYVASSWYIIFIGISKKEGKYDKDMLYYYIIMQKYMTCYENTTISYLVLYSIWRHNGIEMGLLKREQNAFWKEENEMEVIK